MSARAHARTPVCPNPPPNLLFLSLAIFLDGSVGRSLSLSHTLLRISLMPKVEGILKYTGANCNVYGQLSAPFPGNGKQGWLSLFFLGPPRFRASYVQKLGELLPNGYVSADSAGWERGYNPGCNAHMQCGSPCSAPLRYSLFLFLFLLAVATLVCQTTP